jgi:signal transduction histidine kinase
MDPEAVRCCLERNWRGAAASATTGEGSGLGLWIVDNLMRSMRGSVRIDADGDRTAVRLTLPVG